MRIGVDAFPLSIDEASGIPNYLNHTLRAMLNEDEENGYYLYCKNPFRFQEFPNLFLRTKAAASVSPRHSGNALWLFTAGVRMMRKDDVDLFWGPRYLLPPLLPKRVKTVLTVHDLVWHYFPETMDPYNLLVLKFLFKRSLRAADHIIAVSKSTAQAIMDVYGVRNEKITVIHHGTDQYEALDKDASAGYISKKYGTAKHYALTVSTVEPRKNLRMLLRVFSALSSDGLQLLVAGAAGWKTSSTFKEYEDLGLTEKEVRFLGYVPPEDMNRLYSGAGMFLFPSLYEGFGMPLLEAMASGTPVIASNTSSVPEVVDDAGVLLDPYDDDLWRKTILRALSDRGLRDNLSSAGLERARLFTWERTARNTLDVFNKVIKG